MKQISAYQTYDGKIFANEEDAIQHEEESIRTTKEVVAQIHDICSTHYCTFCPFSIKTPTENHCPFQDSDDNFCSPDDWTLKFPAE